MAPGRRRCRPGLRQRQVRAWNTLVASAAASATSGRSAAARRRSRPAPASAAPPEAASRAGSSRARPRAPAKAALRSRLRRRAVDRSLQAGRGDGVGDQAAPGRPGGSSSSSAARGMKRAAQAELERRQHPRQRRRRRWPGRCRCAGAPPARPESTPGPHRRTVPSGRQTVREKQSAAVERSRPAPRRRAGTYQPIAEPLTSTAGRRSRRAISPTTARVTTRREPTIRRRLAGVHRPSEIGLPARLTTASMRVSSAI